MNILIWGHGFVGSAVAATLRQVHKIFIYDRYQKGRSDLKVVDRAKPDAIFICVPTPFSQEQCNIEAIDWSLATMDKMRLYDPPIIIKSTCLPRQVKELINKYPKLNICTNPQFLRERSASQDFRKQRFIIFGTNSERQKQTLRNIYNQQFSLLFIKNKVRWLTPDEAMAVKYIINNMLATKVAMCNVIKNIFEDQNYGSIMQAAHLDVRLGSTHWKVPGPDGRNGFGGSCFPKDMGALGSAASQAQKKLIDSIIEYNKEIRNV